jgi:hypothetical protein
MANAVKGAKIISDNGNTLVYHIVCPSCGDLGSSYAQSVASLGSGVTHSTSYQCPRCNAQIGIEIRG